MKESDTQRLTEEDEGWIGTQRAAFHVQYGAQADAAAVLHTLLRQKNALHKEDYWNCIYTAYPHIFPTAKQFTETMNALDGIFHPNSDFNVLNSHFSPNKWDWDFIRLTQGSTDEPLQEWETKKDKIRNTMAEIDFIWDQLKYQLQELPESIRGRFQDALISRFQKIVDRLRENIKSTEEKIKVLEKKVGTCGSQVSVMQVPKVL